MPDVEDDNSKKLWYILNNYVSTHSGSRFPTRIELKKYAGESGLRGSKFTKALDELEAAKWIALEEKDSLTYIKPTHEYKSPVSSASKMSTEDSKQVSIKDMGLEELGSIVETLTADLASSKGNAADIDDLKNRLNEALAAVTTKQQEMDLLSEKLTQAESESKYMEAQFDFMSEKLKAADEEVEKVAREKEELQAMLQSNSFHNRSNSEDDLLQALEEKMSAEEERMRITNEETEALRTKMKLKEFEANAKAEQLKKFNEKLQNIQTEMAAKEKAMEDMDEKVRLKEEETRNQMAKLQEYERLQKFADMKVSLLSEFYASGAAEFEVKMKSPGVGIHSIFLAGNRLKIKDARGQTKFKGNVTSDFKMSIMEGQGEFAMSPSKKDNFIFLAETDEHADLIKFVFDHVSNIGGKKGHRKQKSSMGKAASGAVKSMFRTLTFRSNEQSSIHDTLKQMKEEEEEKEKAERSKDTSDVQSSKQKKKAFGRKRVGSTVSDTNLGNVANARDNVAIEEESPTMLPLQLPSVRRGLQPPKKEVVVTTPSPRAKQVPVQTNDLCVKDVVIHGENTLGETVRVEATYVGCSEEDCVFQWSTSTDGMKFFPVRGKNTPEYKVSVKDVWMFLQVSVCPKQDGVVMQGTRAHFESRCHCGDSMSKLLNYYITAGEGDFSGLKLDGDAKNKWKILINTEKIKLRVGRKTKVKESLFNEHLKLDSDPNNDLKFTIRMSGERSFTFSCRNAEERDMILLCVIKLRQQSDQ